MAKTIFYSLAALVRKILFCHSKIKFISSRHRVISSIYTKPQLIISTLKVPGQAVSWSKNGRWWYDRSWSGWLYLSSRQPRLSFWAGDQGIPQLLWRWPQTTFIKKWKKSRTTTNPKLFDSQLTCFIYPETWNLSDSPGQTITSNSVNDQRGH